MFLPTFLPLLVAVVVVGYLIRAARRLPATIVVPRHRPGSFGDLPRRFSFEEVELRATDGTLLRGVFVAAEDPKVALIVLHGNGSAKEAYADFVEACLPYGIELLLMDGRGHGASGGTYTTFGHLEVAEVAQAAAWLRARRPRLPTGVFGHSAGGAIATQFLARHPAGIDFGIVESSFANLPEITRIYAGFKLGRLPPRWLSDAILGAAGRLAGFDPFRIRPEAAAREIMVPVLVVHGLADERIPPDHGLRIFTALRGPAKQWYPVLGGTHDDLTVEVGEAYWAKIRGFCLGGYQA